MVLSQNWSHFNTDWELHSRPQTFVSSLSEQCYRNDAFPRPDFISLQTFLTGAKYQGSREDFTSANEALGEQHSCFAVLHYVASGDSQPFAASSSGMDAFAAYSLSLSTPSILFLRGFPTRHWLTTVGQAYGVSPELYRQHYNSLPGEAGRREFFSSPTLPSASARVFQLTIPTIRMGTDEALLDETEDLRRTRDEVANRMKKYLRTTASLADSVVRKCLLLGKDIYVLEQTVTIERQRPRA
ncbi:hypothetical protein NQ176_g2747 [Zarea fungicola]|uniref:Uncharacterized protein n=1 Tax=Zarea fungicola TaxID=93591 RepID=A0ACC1NPJ0_9HYPO|nr:hypothetical protein NQ176_g2747 [Lecanicillium fungicola]